MWEHIEYYIKVEDCKSRRLYRICARNFWLGVYDENTNGFIGMRTKFGSVYAFTEYHWDTGEPYGTVKPIEDLGIDLPDEIECKENLPPLDPKEEDDVMYCGRSNKPLEVWLKEQEEKFPRRQSTNWRDLP